MSQQAAATDPDKTVVLFTEEPRSQSAELPFTAVAVTPRQAGPAPCALSGAADLL